MRRIAILAEGNFDRQRRQNRRRHHALQPDTVVAVIDSTHAGQDAAAALGDPIGPGAGVPVVAMSPRRCRTQPDTLLIGIAPIGGQLARRLARAAARRAFAPGSRSSAACTTSLATTRSWQPPRRAYRARIWDVRRPPRRARACASARGRRIGPAAMSSHFCGTDCNVGKMTACRRAGPRGAAARPLLGLRRDRPDRHHDLRQRHPSRPLHQRLPRRRRRGDGAGLRRAATTGCSSRGRARSAIPPTPR